MTKYTETEVTNIIEESKHFAPYQKGIFFIEHLTEIINEKFEEPKHQNKSLIEMIEYLTAPKPKWLQELNSHLCGIVMELE